LTPLYSASGFNALGRGQILSPNLLEKSVIVVGSVTFYKGKEMQKIPEDLRSYTLL
jgi:hypothetical protein